MHKQVLKLDLRSHNLDPLSPRNNERINKSYDFGKNKVHRYLSQVQSPKKAKLESISPNVNNRQTSEASVQPKNYAGIKREINLYKVKS